MPETKQYKTHYLFLLILATVSRVPSGMTVREIGEVLGYAPDIIAHCIALHLYLERQDREGIPIPPPSAYVAPGPEDIITRGMLAPPEQRGGAPHV
jgi:hypothetical protein